MSTIPPPETLPPIPPADLPPAPPTPTSVDADWSTSHQDNPYWENGVSVEIGRDEGVLQTPLCDDPGTFGNGDAPDCGIVQMHAPTGVKVVEFIAQRAGKTPEIPQPKPTSNNEILKSFSIKQLSPLISDGKTRIHRVLVRTEYYLRKVPDTSDGLVGVKASYDGTSSPATYNINASDFDNNQVAPT